MSAKRYITGIYNYCDYWCERCAFTQRCRNFVSSRAERRQSQDPDGDTMPDDDATNADFWNSLAEQLRETTIFGQANDAGVDAPDPGVDDGPDDEWLEKEEEKRKERKKHPLVILSRDYMMRVHQWLQTADGDLKTVARGLMEDAASGFGTEDVEEKAREIGEMIDVVAWYHTLIPSKLGRAVFRLMGREDVEGEYAGILAQSRQSDANGSGKVALISVERSIAAWMKLRRILPEHEDLILSMLSLLDRLRRRIKIDLPDSATFLRPGFDGENVGLFDDD